MFVHLLGSFGLFFTLFLLFLKILTNDIYLSEVKGVMPQANVHHHDSEERMRYKEGVLGQVDTAKELIHCAEKLRDPRVQTI